MKKFFETKTSITRSYGTDNIAAIDSHEDEVVTKANQDLEHLKKLMPELSAQTDKFFDEMEGKINPSGQRAPINGMFYVTKKETVVETDCCSCTIL